MNKVYDRINWENTPSIATPINESNLNKMDYAIDEIDRRVVDLASKDSTLNEAIQKANESIEKLNNDSADFKAFNERQDNPHNVTKEQVGLGKVDNTADKDKYVFHAHASDIASGDRNGKVIDLVYETIENVNSKDAETLKAAKEYADTVVESTNLTKTATGTTLHLTDTVDGKARINNIIRNLIELSATSTSINGINVSINNDGSLTFKGTPTKDVFFKIGTATKCYGDTVTISGQPTSDKKNRLYVVDNGENKNHFADGVNGNTWIAKGMLEIKFAIYYQNGAVDVTVYPMLELGTTAHPYVPYEGYEVKSCRNLFDENGTFIDGLVKRDGTQFYEQYSKRQLINVSPNTQYIMGMKDGRKTGTFWYSMYTNDDEFIGTYIQEELASYVKLTAPSNCYKIAVFCSKSKTEISNQSNIFFSKMSEYYSVTITPNTESAFIKTYDGETNVWTDYDTDLTLHYGINKDGANVVAASGKQDKLTKSAHGSYVHLTDSLEGKAKVSGFVHNLAKSFGLPSTNPNNQYWSAIKIECKLEPNTYYTISGKGTPNNQYYIEDDNINGGGNVTLDSNGCFSFTVKTQDKSNINSLSLLHNVVEQTNAWSNVQVEIGTTAHPYVPYTYEVKSCGKNLFSKNGITTNAYLDSSGNKTGNGDWGYSDYIEVSNDSYILNYGKGTGMYTSICFYDTSKNFVSAIEYNYKQNLEIVRPNNAKYARLSFIIKDIDAVYFVIKDMLSQTTITTDTDVAYVDTFDGETNIFTDYDIDMNVEYGANEIGSQILANTGEIAMLKAEIEALKG